MLHAVPARPSLALFPNVLENGQMGWRAEWRIREMSPVEAQGATPMNALHGLGDKSVEMSLSVAAVRKLERQELEGRQRQIEDAKQRDAEARRQQADKSLRLAAQALADIDQPSWKGPASHPGSEEKLGDPPVPNEAANSTAAVMALTVRGPDLHQAGMSDQGDWEIAVTAIRQAPSTGRGQIVDITA